MAPVYVSASQETSSLRKNFARDECCQNIDFIIYLFIFYFYLLLYSVGRLCCPRFPVAVWVRCLISAKRIWEDENDKVFSGQLPSYVVGAQKTGVHARQVPWMGADAVAPLLCPSWMLFF